MAQIIDGYTGTPNIYADDMREYNRSLYGVGDYVLQIGECLGYELISNNEIQIKDGIFMTQGARGLIKKGTTESCIIENGAQDVNRNDLIVIEYAKDEITQIESHTLKVIKGTAGAEATDPDITSGEIANGAILHQMPLYRVKIEGLSIVAVEQLFEFGSVAAETVDPMEATEPGFAADAYQTKLQFDEQIKNLESLSEKFLNYEPVDVLSGTVSYVQPKNSCLTQLVTFEKPFGTTPVVTASGYYTSGSTNYGIEPTISEITPVGFKIRDISYMSEVTIVFNWHAYAPA